MRTAPAPLTPGAAPARRRRRTWPALAVSAAALVALGAGCSSTNPTTETGSGSSTGVADASSSSVSSTAPPAGNVGPSTTTGQSSSGGNASGGNSSGGNSSGGNASTAPAPVITSFSTPESIDCHNGNSQTFTASWSTTGAERVTISIDGPGVYKEYPATGSDSLPFDCSTSHSFLLTAYGADGQMATRTITLQPRNVVPPSSDTDEES